MNRRSVTKIALMALLGTGIILVGVGCALAIVPATLIGVFLIGSGATGILFTRMR